MRGIKEILVPSSIGPLLVFMGSEGMVGLTAWATMKEGAHIERLLHPAAWDKPRAQDAAPGRLRWADLWHQPGCRGQALCLRLWQGRRWLRGRRGHRLQVGGVQLTSRCFKSLRGFKGLKCKLSTWYIRDWKGDYPEHLDTQSKTCVSECPKLGGQVAPR